MSLAPKIESLLLVASKPLNFKKLERILKVDKKTIEQAVIKLKQEYKASKRGFRIVSNQAKVELATAPENAKIVKKLIKFEQKEISQAKLEALTVLAYQGPLTKAELENIRGVNCSLILRNLKIEDFVDETSKNSQIYYQVSTKFLKMLAITSVEELPEYNQCSQNSF